MIDLKLIEVQSGFYLGEDDIVRFEDRFGQRYWLPFSIMGHQPGINFIDGLVRSILSK